MIWYNMVQGVGHLDKIYFKPFFLHAWPFTPPEYSLVLPDAILCQMLVALKKLVKLTWITAYRCDHIFWCNWLFLASGPQWNVSIYVSLDSKGELVEST